MFCETLNMNVGNITHNLKFNSQFTKFKENVLLSSKNIFAFKGTAVWNANELEFSVTLLVYH
jgi:hypothetical protein